MCIPGSNPFFSVHIRCYPFKQEPPVSVGIRCEDAWDTNGTIRFQRERIRTDTNREQRIRPVCSPGSNPFFSVHIGSYPCRLEPPVSVGIRYSEAWDTNGTRRFQRERIRTDTNGRDPCSSLAGTWIAPVRPHGTPYRPAAVARFPARFAWRGLLPNRFPCKHSDLPARRRS